MGVVQQAVGTVEPDYFQFYARREGAEWHSDQVPQEGYEAHLWTSQGFVYIGTSRKFGTTSVLLEVLDVPPHEPDAEWQHVAEASLPADAGTTLQGHNWDGEAPALEVDIDTSAFCLRVHWQGLAKTASKAWMLTARAMSAFCCKCGHRRRRTRRSCGGGHLGTFPTRSDTSTDGRRQVEGLQNAMTPPEDAVASKDTGILNR